jgi:pimeloyl-ACP methyl ester carboxylesterase
MLLARPASTQRLPSASNVETVSFDSGGGNAMRVVFVHGACVRDGAWWWHLTAQELAQHGIASVTPSLPSCGESDRAAGGDGPGLSEDVAEVRRVLLSSDEPTVLVVHSYGGIVAAEAAAGVAAVRHLLLISSYLPEVGQSLSSFGDGSPAPFLDIDLDALTFRVRPDALVETFLADCPSEIAAEALDHLAGQSLSVTQQPVQAAAWRQLPTTYLVCADDRGTPVSAQRVFAQRADHVVELESGHHPFLSQPRAVADLILSLR